MTGSRHAWVYLLAGLAVLAALTSGCGDSEPARGASGDGRSDRSTYRDARRGYSVRFPRSWHRATTPASPALTEPREILTLATFSIPAHRATNCEAFAGSARSQMSPGDVVLTVQERGYDPDSEWADFPARPARFGPADPQPGEPGEHGCGDPPGTTIHWRNFSDAGRHFHTLVAVGPSAPATAQEQAWAILDSLRFNVDRRPTWPASP